MARRIVTPRFHTSRIPTGLLQTGDVAAKLTNKYELHGKVAVTSMADQLYPVVLVDDLSSSGRDWWQQPQPGGERRYWVYSIVAPVAAQFGVMILENPANSGVIFRIEAVATLSVTNCVFRTGRCSSFPGSPADTFAVRDSRIGATAPFNARKSTNATTQIDAGIFQEWGTLANPFTKVDVDCLIGPNERWGVEIETANTQLNCGIYWSVRSAAV